MESRPVDEPRLSYGPARVWAWAYLGVAVVAAVTAVVADVQGRVLAVAVAVAFAALAAADLLAGPRLTVDDDGVVVRGPVGRRRFGWDDLEAVRVDERVRFGRVVQALELDAGADLVVLGPRPLGTDPVTVARRVVACAPADRRAALGGDVRTRGDRTRGDRA